jgi:hypothetical protein
MHTRQRLDLTTIVSCDMLKPNVGRSRIQEETVVSNQKPDAVHAHRAGICRREVLQVGFLGAFGMFMSDALASPKPQTKEPASPKEKEPEPRAQRVILVWMPGGPPQMQLWDLKPNGIKLSGLPICPPIKIGVCRDKTPMNRGWKRSPDTSGLGNVSPRFPSGERGSHP